MNRATRIHKSLTWWQKALPQGLRAILAKLWPYTLTLGVVSMLMGLYIAITGNIPWSDISDPERILNICWAFVFGGGWGMFILSFVFGFSADIEHRES